MNCQKCNSSRVCRVCAKCSDMCNISFNKIESCDYVPEDIGVGGGDYLDFYFCFDCGQLQGKFPLAKTQFEIELSDEVLKDFFEEHFNFGEIVRDISSARKHQIKKNAENINAILYSYIKNMFYVDFESTDRIPDAEKLIEMYKNNSYEF